MTRSDADAQQQSSQLLWNSEIWRVVVNVQHRLEDGYEPSDMDSLRLDCCQLLSKPEGRIKYRPTGSLWINVNNCGLRLEKLGEVVAACGDSSDKVLEQFKQLVGKMLIRIDVMPPGGDANFVLENDLCLRCFPANSRGAESWGVDPPSR